MKTFTFSDFQLMPDIKKSLDGLGFKTPTEIQAQAIPLLLGNPHQDVHAQAQTGTGKTLAFGIPLLQSIDKANRNVQGLVVAPTRELVLQIYESLKEVSRNSGIGIEPIYGGMPINRQIQNIKRGAQIIIGTPGRLNDHIRRKTLSLNNLKILILDEADIMLDMGFKQEIDEILSSAPKNRNIWLFSATVMAGINQLINSHMQNVQKLKAKAQEVATTQVKQYYCVCPTRKRMEAVARFIESAPEFYGIIFCQTKLLTAEVMEQLASRGFRANCLHGDMKQALRNQVIKGFKNKDFTILVATDVAARGIDVSDLTHVVNYSMPEDKETYIHRIGRTGRAGKAGIAITLISPSDMHRIKRLEKIAQVQIQELPIPSADSIIHAKISGVSDFIEQSKKAEIKSAVLHEALKKLIESFSIDEIKQAFLVALEDRFFKGMSGKEIEDIEQDSVGTSYPQEICMEVGTEHGLSENDLRDYLYRTCSLLPQDVRKVRVLQRKTFISIPENRLQSCMASLRQNPIDRKKYKVYFVEDHFRSERGGFNRRRPMHHQQKHRSRKRRR